MSFWGKDHLVVMGPVEIHQMVPESFQLGKRYGEAVHPGLRFAVGQKGAVDD